MTVEKATAPHVDDVKPVLAVILGAIAMGCSPILQRLSDVGPFASAFWRLGLALPILYLWMVWEDKQRAPQAARAARFPLPTILAGLAFAADLFFWHLSVSKTSVANATFFATSAPVWVIIIGFVLWRTKVASNVMIGLGFCLLGGAALVWQSFHFAPERLTGDFYGALTAVFFGAYFLCVEAGRRSSGPARITFEMSVIAAIILFFVAYFFEPRLIPQSAVGWLTMITLAWVSHAGGQGLLSYALGRLPATFSSLVIFIEAVAAAGLSWLILGEALSVLQVLGGVCILVGIYVARPKPR